MRKTTGRTGLFAPTSGCTPRLAAQFWSELHLRLAYGPAFEGVLQKAQGQQGR